MKAFGPEQHGLAQAVQTVNLDPVPSRAMAICAHPDDADFFIAGTFAKWAATGTECVYVVCTDGSLGSWDDLAPAELVSQREKEQLAAAAAVGVKVVEFLRHKDGFLNNDLILRRDLVTQIRRHRPDVVATHDPWQPYRLHPDHRTCGFTACDAVATAREPLAWPDICGPAHRAEQLLLFETDSPDHFENVETTFAAKMAALYAHTSQWLTTFGIQGDYDSAGLSAFRSRMEAWASRQGIDVGLHLAEAFKRVDV